MKDINESVFKAAMRAWEQGAELRRRRRRWKDYTYGRQWNDSTVTEDGKVVTEGEDARLNGANPLTNNMLRQLVKCVIGHFRQRIALEENDSRLNDETCLRNAIDELDARMLEEFLISGCAIQRVVRERRLGGDGVWIDNVSPEEFFVSGYRDPRGHDIELLGMVHDMNINEAIMRFAGRDGHSAKELRNIYRDLADPYSASITGLTFGASPSTLDFLSPREAGRCRAIEVWTLDSRSVLKCRDGENGERFMVSPAERQRLGRINDSRRRNGRKAVESRGVMTVRWHCRWFAPTGQLLAEYDSPWAHGFHPFIVKMYPFIDGEVHPFVEDVIDQQRHINRLITTIDHVMNAAAKSAVLFPLEVLPEGHTIEEFSRRWARPGAFIPYDSRKAKVTPELMSQRGGEWGATSLLDIEMRLMEKVSGVGNAFQGLSPQTGDASRMSAALYQSQAENSVAGLRDIYDTFDNFRRLRDQRAAQM